jgi:DNA-binding HxlR family transcriptional regulator
MVGAKGLGDEARQAKWAPQVPPKTEYRLTDNGHKLREPIAWLCEWGMNNREFIDGIIKARAEAVLTKP